MLTIEQIEGLPTILTRFIEEEGTDILQGLIASYLGTENVQGLDKLELDIFAYNIRVEAIILANDSVIPSLFRVRKEHEIIGYFKETGVGSQTIREYLAASTAIRELLIRALPPFDDLNTSSFFTDDRHFVLDEESQVLRERERVWMAKFNRNNTTINISRFKGIDQVLWEQDQSEQAVWMQEDQARLDFEQVLSTCILSMEETANLFKRLKKDCLEILLVQIGLEKFYLTAEVRNRFALSSKVIWAWGTRLMEEDYTTNFLPEEKGENVLPGFRARISDRFESEAKEYRED